jgi:hypothetical protein
LFGILVIRDAGAPRARTLVHAPEDFRNSVDGRPPRRLRVT